jgi:hypothetical protein
MHTRTSLTAALFSAALCAASPVAAQPTPGTVPGTYQGPESSATPYVIPSAAGWEVVSLITVGDPARNGYRMVGIPDGLGALAGKSQHGNYVADKQYLTVFMNHELVATSGVARAHGQPGAFVSEWSIHLNTLQVKAGEDLIHDVYAWDPTSASYVFAPTTTFGRLCSADLPAETAFFNEATGKGFDGRLFMDGEETGDEGRGFGHVVTGDLKGTSYQLPYLGRFSWENNVAHPNAGDRTVVVGLDDSTPGQVYVYVGTKRSTGNPVERAGLVGGKLFGIKVTNGGANYANGPVTRENHGAIRGTFVLQDVSDVATGSGATLQTTSVARQITEFARPEDGAWDTANPQVFYFVITGARIDGQDQSAKLYKLTFNSVDNPTGGTIDLALDRAALMPVTPLFPQFDNITVAGDGAVILQEDTGDNAYLARTWRYNPATGMTREILISDPARFQPPTPAPFNQDEENSGVIEVTDLVQHANWYEPGRRYFLGDTQAHYTIPGELIEGGQLYLFISPRP